MHPPPSTHPGTLTAGRARDPDGVTKVSVRWAWHESGPGWCIHTDQDHRDLKRRSLWLNLILLLAAAAMNLSPVLQEYVRAAEQKDQLDVYGWSYWS